MSFFFFFTSFLFLGFPVLIFQFDPRAVDQRSTKASAGHGDQCGAPAELPTRPRYEKCHKTIIHSSPWTAALLSFTLNIGGQHLPFIDDGLLVVGYLRYETLKKKEKGEIKRANKTKKKKQHPGRSGLELVLPLWLLLPTCDWVQTNVPFVTSHRASLRSNSLKDDCWREFFFLPSKRPLKAWRRGGAVQCSKHKLPREG